MKQLLLLSGKGGTGKTTTAAAFIRFANAHTFADCDVDAPNLHLIMNMQEKPQESNYFGLDKAYICPEKCTACGKCASLCRFNAIQKRENIFEINEFACEGCGVCEFVCPEKAVIMKKDIAGKLTLYKEKQVFSTAELKMGRGNSGKLVSEVKCKMYQSASNTDLAIVDGSPGIGCPVIASVSGVDFVLIVTEPSHSGLSDLTRLLNTASYLQTPAAVCINKYDIAPQKANEIQEFCTKENIPFVGKIPYDKKASEAINNGKSIADIPCPMRDALKEVFDNMMKLLEVTI